MAVATAPGKIMLAGEYAILDGGSAVMIAVDRRARATLVADGQAPPAPSPFLAAAARALAAELGENHPATRAAARVVVDTAALADGDRKLGLGSSAAATVAAIAACLSSAGETADPPRVHRLAHRAHGDAQAPRGARGSGADVAASTFGGVLEVSPREGDAPAVAGLTLPRGLALVPVWTGSPADTVPLVAAVRAFAGARADAYRPLAAALTAAAAALAAACRADDAAAAVAALADGATAITALGDAAGLPLSSPRHHRLAELARAAGGTSKPTGAGAGDIALAAFADPDRAAGFRAALAATGMTALDLRVDPRGVTVGDGGPTAGAANGA